MNRLLNRMLASAALIALTSTAWAGSPDEAVSKQNEVYVSGDLGNAWINTPNKNIITSEDIANLDVCDGSNVSCTLDGSNKEGHLAGGVNVGYNRLINNRIRVGAEFGYNNNGQSKYTESYSKTTIFNMPIDVVTHNGDGTLKVTSKDFHLLATTSVGLGYGFEVFGKAGAARVKQTGKLSGTYDDLSDSSKFSDTQYEPMLATGLGYRYKAVYVFAQYTHTFGKNISNFDDLVELNSNNELQFANIASVDAVKGGVAFTLAI